MSNKFKAAGYVEGFDLYEDGIVDAQGNPTWQQRVLIFVILLVPVLLMLAGTVLVKE